VKGGSLKSGAGLWKAQRSSSSAHVLMLRCSRKVEDPTHFHSRGSLRGILWCSEVSRAVVESREKTPEHLDSEVGGPNGIRTRVSVTTTVSPRFSDTCRTKRRQESARLKHAGCIAPRACRSTSMGPPLMLTGRGTSTGLRYSLSDAGRPDVNGGRRGGASARRGDGPRAAPHLIVLESEPQQSSHGSSRHLRGGGSLTGCEGREAVGQ
jgi:hypothetical protein